MEEEDGFSPPPVEYENPSAGYMAGLLALSSGLTIEDEPEVGLGPAAGVDQAGFDDEPPEYLPEPPDYDQEVYDDEAADVGRPTFDALYDLAVNRIDDHSAGAQEGTRLHRGRSVPASDISPAAPVPSWWRREMYHGIEDICLGSAPLHSGVPYGPGVTGANWSEAHLKVRDLAGQNKYYNAIRAGPGAKGSSYEATPEGVVECIWETQPYGGRPRTEFFFKLGIFECSVYFEWEDDDYCDVRDLYMSCDLLTIRRKSVAVATMVNLVFAAYSVAVVEEQVTPPSVLQLCNSGLKDMKTVVNRTQHGATMAKRSGMVAHALCTRPEDLSGVSNEQHVDFSMWQRERGVYHGRLRASDVPPSQLVLLCANGGLSVSGSLVVVRALATHSISLICTSATANCAFKPAMQGKKFAPCVRDGLMSPIACAALHGDARGMLTVTVGAEKVQLNTVLTDAIDNNGVAELDTLDINGTRAALSDLGALCGYKTKEWLGARVYWMKFQGHGRNMQIAMRYRAGAQARWESLLCGEARRAVSHNISEQTDSEIGLDWGASGLGRYLLSRYTKHGLLRAKKIMVAKRGPFSALTYDDKGRRRIIAPSAEVLDYVIDTEFVTVKRGGEVMTYVYALGIAKFSHGAYMGSWVAMDEEENTTNFMKTLDEKEAGGHAKTITRLRADDVPSCDMVEMLQAIRSRLLTNPNVRVYAKGREAEQRLMTSSVAGGTRMFRAQAAAAGDLIRELGPLLPRYEEAAQGVGWRTLHNPAREAVLFGYLAGLGYELPSEERVGLDGLDALLPVFGGTQI